MLEPTFKLLNKAAIVTVPDTNGEVEVGRRDNELVVVRVVAAKHHATVIARPLINMSFQIQFIKRRNVHRWYVQKFEKFAEYDCNSYQNFACF